VATWECATQGQLAKMLHNPAHPALVASRFNLSTAEFSFSPHTTAAELTKLADDFRKNTDATYAIVLGPVRLPEQTELDVPYFEVVISYDKGADVQRYNFTGHPDILFTKAAKQAINQLRLHIKNAD